MKKKDYGGAFDIDPEMYWTRDDLNELQQAVEEYVQKDKPREYFKIKELYLDVDNRVDLTYLDIHDNEYQLWANIVLNPNKAGTTTKMVEKYAPEIHKAITEELLSIQNELDEEEYEEYM